MQAFPIRRNGEHSTKDNLKLKAGLKLDTLQRHIHAKAVEAWDKTNFYFEHHSMQGYERHEH